MTLDLDAIRARLVAAVEYAKRHPLVSSAAVRSEQHHAVAISELAALLDALEAAQAEVERLSELADHARLLGPARMVLDRCAVALVGMNEGMEAERVAQQIVDLIGHPATDEPPHALVERDELRTEVERLQAENEALANEVMAHQTTSDYERGHEHGTAAGLAARNVVPRSALVQVGSVCERCGYRDWHDGSRGEDTLHSSLCGPFPIAPPAAEAAYVIRTDSEETS